MAAERKEDVHAVVLSGGGANGAYEIGVMKALLAGKSPTTHYKPLNPTIFLGTSVGSYNASYLVSHWNDKGSAAHADLEQVWLEQISQRPPTFTNGAFRVRGLNALNPFCYFPNPMRNINQFFDDVTSVSGNMSQRVIELFSGNAPIIDRVFGLMEMSVFISNDPLIELIANTINFAKIRTSDKKLIIAATNWAKGETQLFRENEMSDQLGPDIIRASAAIPGIYPQQSVGAFTYVDGGVLMNTPLSPAIDAGANILHVISLNPEVEKIPLPEKPNMVETILRQQTMTWVKAVDQNVNKVYYANRLLEVANLTRQLVERGINQFVERGIGGSADTTLTLNISPEIDELMTMRRPWEQHVEIKDRTIQFDVRANLEAETAPYVPVTVYLYRPNAALGGALGMGDFRYDRILQLIERGFNDAVNFQENDKNYVAPYPLRYKQAQSRVDYVARITRAEPFVRQPEDE